MNGRTSRTFPALVAILFLFLSALLSAQTTANAGNISGTVTDPSGAAVTDARVAITNLANRRVVNVTTNSAGVYNSGALAAGNYEVTILFRGLGSLTDTASVDAGKTTVLDFEFQLGQEQPTLQGELIARQVRNLPVNGRNFLNFAQFEPGVQVQDAEGLDPTKSGYSAVSFGGRFGRSARIEVDGGDVTDETVGTTTIDIPASAIQEFHSSQSTLDLAAGLTSSGMIKITTKNGTNSYHGEAFGFFRDSSFSAKLPSAPGPFQRSQYGGDLGGAIIKDKAFFFVDGERTLQHTKVPVLVSAPFSQYSGSFTDPFSEDDLMGRLDYAFSKGAHAFYRFSYFRNSLNATSGLGFSVYNNVDIARNHVVGVDFNRGNISHSLRFSYLDFQNRMGDQTVGSSLPFAGLGAEISLGASGLSGGPNYLAPQSTAQRDEEIRYDGTKIIGPHTLRFGGSFNHLVAGGFASFNKNGPQILSNVSTTEIAVAAGGPFPGGASNPLNYPADFMTISNGLSFSSSQSALGFSAGELGPDNRVILYVGDNWKPKRTFVLSYGLRYDRDTNRTDSQYAAIPELNAMSPGLGNPIRQPNSNIAPQAGFAWDPSGNGKTSVRAGVGLYWENALWNNMLFDAPRRERNGSFLQFVTPCAAPGRPVTLQSAAGPIVAGANVCGTTTYPLIGKVLPAVIALQQQWNAASPSNMQAKNPSYVGQYLTDCGGGTNCYFAPGLAMLDPSYKSPRSVQMNVGIQREIRRNMVLSVDYVRNIETHYLLGVDKNLAGSANLFDVNAARQAIAKTIADCGGGATSVVLTYSRPCPSDPANGTSDGGTYLPRRATIGDYAANGLGSSADMGGNSCLHVLGYNCAFGGINPLSPPLPFLSPVGRSVYRAFQMKLTHTVESPFAGAKVLNFQVAYALSRLQSSGSGVAPDNPATAASGDQDFITPALDNVNVDRYFGPSTLDRTHQVSFAGFIDLRGGFRLGILGHLASPLSTTLLVPNTGTAGQIFQTDFTGDGTTQDPIPGTHFGNFDRGVDASSINNRISAYNASVAGEPTPAGNVLIGASLMSAADLAALGGVAPVVPAAPAGQVNYSWLKVFDTTLAWTYTYKDKITIRPSVGIFNVLNITNFDLPDNMMSGLVNGAPGSVNGTNYNSHFVNRVGVGSGVYSEASPRQIEAGLRISF